jgi:hypothetical protein
LNDLASPAVSAGENPLLPAYSIASRKNVNRLAGLTARSVAVPARLLQCRMARQYPFFSPLRDASFD